LGWRAQAVAAEFSNRTPDQIYQFAKGYIKRHKWTDKDRAEHIGRLTVYPTVALALTKPQPQQGKKKK
jgi:hypothetical protein